MVTLPFVVADITGTPHASPARAPWPGRALNAVYVASIALILLTPVFNLWEIVAVFQNEFVDQRATITPTWIKAVKDGAMLLFTGALLAAAAAHRRAPGDAASGRMTRLGRLAVAAYALFVVALLTAAAATLALGSAPIVQRALQMAAGLRWALPFFLIGAVGVAHRAAGFDAGRFGPALARAVVLVFLISFLAQLYQFVYRPPPAGQPSTWLPDRVAGVYLIPNTAAFLACLAVWCSWFDLKRSPLRWVVFAVAPVSILLARSGGGVVAYAAFVLLNLAGDRALLLKLALSPVLAVALFANLDVLTLRPDIQRGGEQRAQIFTEALAEADWVSTRFGGGTNTGVMLTGGATMPEDTVATVTDSVLAAVAVNAGRLGFAAFVAMIAATGAAIVFRRAPGARRLLSFLAIAAVFATSTQVSEAFPMNLMMALALGGGMPALTAAGAGRADAEEQG